jgi:hypothetical protein
VLAATLAVVALVSPTTVALAISAVNVLIYIVVENINDSMDYLFIVLADVGLCSLVR